MRLYPDFLADTVPVLSNHDSALEHPFLKAAVGRKSRDAECAVVVQLYHGNDIAAITEREFTGYPSHNDPILSRRVPGGAAKGFRFCRSWWSHFVL